MKLFSRIFFTVFFMLFAGILFYLFYKNKVQKRENTAMQFRAAVTGLQLKHGSSSQYFVDLSNGKTFFFTIPYNSLHIGDSVIKIKKESFFTAKKRDGAVLYKVGVDGKMMSRY